MNNPNTYIDPTLSTSIRGLIDQSASLGLPPNEVLDHMTPDQYDQTRADIDAEMRDAPTKLPRVAVTVERSYGDESYTAGRWGTEFPEVFAFDRTMRGKFDSVPHDPQDWSGAHQLAAMGGTVNMGGKFDRLIVELSDGHMVMIIKLNPKELGAKDQKFAMVSTMDEQRVREGKARPIDTSTLEGIILAPNTQFALGRDPYKPGSPRIRSHALVTKITGINWNDPDGRVSASHAAMKDPNQQSDVVERFNLAMQQARVAAGVGSVGVRHSGP